MLKDKVLYMLEQRKEEIVTGGELAKSFGVSRTSIWKAIHTLQEEGNAIISVPNVGYRLSATNDTLSEAVITERISTRFIGRTLTVLPCVRSTNQYLKEMDAECLDNGHVLVADEQSQGRGRRNRIFVSDKGAGVYLSILLKLSGQQHNLRLLTICTAVAVSRAIERICPIRIDIKWVNDLFCNGKKLCGILTEATLSAELQELDRVIIGIGINTGNLAEGIKDIATSIKEETGICGIRNRLVAGVVNQFEAVYMDYMEHGRTAAILKEYENRLFILDQSVLVKDFAEEYPAVVQGIDQEGALLVLTQNGEVRHLVSGEILLQS